MLLSSFFDTVFETCLVRISHFLSGSLTLQVAEFMEQDSLLLSQRLLELDNCLLSFIAVSVNIVKNCSGIIHNVCSQKSAQQSCDRIGNPLDVANMMLFLCSDKARFINGENICIYSGMTKLMIYHGDTAGLYQNKIQHSCSTIT